MSKPYFPADHTPAEWRNMRADSVRREAESWERSDTDGFLSQWASQCMARLYSYLAELAENNGVETFIGLADMAGNLLDAKIVDGKYGPVWCIRQADGSAKWFNESSARKGATRKAAHDRKGYKLVNYTAEAVVFLSNTMQPSPYPVPKRDAVKTVTGEIEYKDF